MMLHSDKDYTVQRIAVSMIVIPGWDGMNLQRFTFWFNQLMRTPDKDVDPITIEHNVQMNCFTIKDGRHRFLATVFACRPTIPCIIDIQTDVDYTILGDNHYKQ